MKACRKVVTVTIFLLLFCGCGPLSIAIINTYKYSEFKVTLGNCREEIPEFFKPDSVLNPKKQAFFAGYVKKKGRVLFGKPEYYIFEKIVYDSATYQLPDKAGKELRRDSVVFTFEEFNAFLDSEYDRLNYKRTMSITIETDRIFENSMDSIAQ